MDIEKYIYFLFISFLVTIFERVCRGFEMNLKRIYGLYLSQEDLLKIEPKLEEVYSHMKEITEANLYDEFPKILEEVFGSVERAGIAISLFAYRFRFCRNYADKISELLFSRVRNKWWRIEITREIYDWLYYCYPLFKWHSGNSKLLKEKVNKAAAILRYYIYERYGFDVPRLYIRRIGMSRKFSFERKRIYINLYSMLASVVHGVYDCPECGVEIKSYRGDVQLAVCYVIYAFARYIAYKEKDPGVENIKRHMRELYNVLKQYGVLGD